MREAILEGFAVAGCALYPTASGIDCLERILAARRDRAQAERSSPAPSDHDRPHYDSSRPSGHGNPGVVALPDCGLPAQGAAMYNIRPFVSARTLDRSPTSIRVRPVVSRNDRAAFIDLAFAIYADDPHWVPPLKSEVAGLIDRKTNPWFEHARAAFLLAERDGRVVGRIAAHIDELWKAMPPEQGGGAHLGHWGLLEASDADAAQVLIEAAERWLRSEGAGRAVGPLSLSIWDEPGLLVAGHDHPPTVMMGHHRPDYAGWIEAAGYRGIRNLVTYDLDIATPFPPLIHALVASADRSPRIRIRRIDKRRFEQEAALILGLLNDAWSSNWGFVPLTPAEIAYAGKKLKPVIYESLNYVAELDGEPVAFMMTLPDLNELTRDLNGSLLPFGWARLLWRLRSPQVRTLRVPLMGVARRLHGSRLASQLAFAMIERTRQEAGAFGATRAEIGWILDVNQGMRSIADAVGARVNKVYRLYERDLSLRPDQDRP